MKAKHLGIMAMAAMMLASCGGKLPEGKDLKDLKNATTEDSVANMLGQSMAMNYWQMAMNDTTLKTEKGRDAYLEGFMKGMSLLSDDEAYNAGLRSGMENAMNLKKINKDYQLNMSDKQFLTGMSFGLKSDSAVNREQVQTVMNTIGMRLETQKRERDKAAATKALNNVVSKEKLTKNGTYAYKVTKKGNGNAVGNGTYVLLDLSVKDENGKDIFPSMGPQPVEVGTPGFPQAVSDVLANMQPGSEAVVYSSMSDLGLQRGGDPASLAKVTLKLVGLCNEKGEAVTEPVQGPSAKARAEGADKVPATQGKVVDIPAPEKAAAVPAKK